MLDIPEVEIESSFVVQANELTPILVCWRWICDIYTLFIESNLTEWNIHTWKNMRWITVAKNPRRKRTLHFWRIIIIFTCGESEQVNKSCVSSPFFLPKSKMCTNISDLKANWLFRHQVSKMRLYLTSEAVLRLQSGLRKYHLGSWRHNNVGSNTLMKPKT